MRSIILAISLVSLAAPGSGAPVGRPQCANDPTAHLARPGGDAQSKKLTDLPPADAYHAVFRRGADGCMVPVKMNDRYGKPDQQSPTQALRRR